MIDSFCANDGAYELGFVMVNMFEQFGLCIGWSRDEDRTNACN